MPTLFVQKTGFLNLTEVLRGRGTTGDGIINQLKLMGFTEVYGKIGDGVPIPPDLVTGRPEVPGDNSIDVTLEAPSTFSLGSQKWRIKFYGRGEIKTITYPDLTKEIFQISNSGFPNYTVIQTPYNPPQYQTSTVSYETAPKILSVFVGSDIQLPGNENTLNPGSWGFSTNYATSTNTNFNITDAAGHIAAIPWGTPTSAGSTATYVDPPTTHFPPSQFYTTRGLFFYSRAEFGDDGLPVPTTGANPNTQSTRGSPMSYVLSYTTRGLFFGIWNSDTPHTALRFSWCLIQRSVDRTTGAVRGTTQATATSECPLFCVFGCETSVGTAPTSTVPFTVAPKHDYGIMVVREKSTSSPGPKIVYSAQSVNFVSGATECWSDREDTPIFLNPAKQVSFNEDGNYMVTFISELASSRYRYPDELDMVGTISADVIGIGQELQFTVYGEAQPRTYIALPANGPFNTGMRLLVLKSNPNDSA